MHDNLFIKKASSFSGEIVFIALRIMQLLKSETNPNRSSPHSAAKYDCIKR
jgi:hypothetical protein